MLVRLKFAQAARNSGTRVSNATTLTMEILFGTVLVTEQKGPLTNAPSVNVLLKRMKGVCT